MAVGVGAASVREIDQLNIYHATHLAMRRAIARVGGHEHVLVDGNRIAGFEAQVGPYTNIVDGDAKVYSIACASVVAKVVRDRMMERLALRYPGYGWEHNQGYATRDHRDAIRALGLTPFHRRSFLALQRTLAGDQLDFDLLADPSASPETHDLLERELVPVMADDATLDALDLATLGADHRLSSAAVTGRVSAAGEPPDERRSARCGAWMTGRRTRDGPRRSRPAMPPRALAASMLLAAGWTILARNVHVGRYEIDLVAVDPGPPPALVVVEVRWRAARDFGLPEETVDHRKRARVRAAAYGLLDLGRLPDGSRLPRLPLRFDLVVVEPRVRGAGEPRVRHHRAAF